jgi:16S rRNA (adenine1518-N6/adenine1519-N6)-dimethyltransferase
MARKPRLGQHFLNDPSAARAIADALGDLRQKTVLEIGPGQGAITELLATRAKRLIAVELDHDMALQLRMHFANTPNVEVIERDILQVDLAELARNAAGSGDEKIAVVGNLPYYITSDILLRLFSFHAVVSQAILMVQREVADRLAALPGTRDYGLLSATTQLYARVEKLFTLAPEAFSPPPDVHSTVLRLTMRPRWEELGVEPEPFIEFLRNIFGQKRKTLANNLRTAGYTSEQAATAFAQCDIPPQVRAEAIPLETAAALHRALISSG